jgi:hypothetical protein
MSVNIRKVVLDSQGRVIEEYEGNEAEVEAYEKKKSKREQTETAKKEKKLLLEASRALDKMAKKELIELIQKTLAEQAARQTTVYEWHYHGGWYWKPYWDAGRWTYLTTTNISPSYSNVISCNSVDELSKNIGLDAVGVYSSLLADQGNVLAAPGNSVTEGTLTAKIAAILAPASSGWYSVQASLDNDVVSTGGNVDTTIKM